MDMTEQLANYLRAQMPAARDLVVTELERKSGGASRETWAVTAQWVENGDAVSREFILRRDPTRSLLESDRAREFHVLKALYDSGIPVPRMYWLELDGTRLERPFFIMEKLPGQAPIGTFPPGYPPAVQARVAEQFVDILARIHCVDWHAHGFEFLGVPGGGADAARTQVGHWHRIYIQECIEPHPILEEAFIWLSTHLPLADRITLVHGDYRSGNYLFTDDGTVTAMLDWEMVHLGDPMEDLGWACMKFWSGRGLVVGLTTREDFFTRYSRASGIPIDESRVFFYEVLGTVKMAVIALTGVRTFCEGKTHEASMPLVGFLVPRLLRDLTDQLQL
jgi:aminoglycoside phosphotransferase (APT) family kinase protein